MPFVFIRQEHPRISFFLLGGGHVFPKLTLLCWEAPFWVGGGANVCESVCAPVCERV